MTVSDRDKRALIGLAAAALVFLAVWRFTSPSDQTAQAVSVPESIPLAERRLTRLRRVGAAVSGKQQVLDQVSAELAQREKGIIQADSVQQAQARVMQILRAIGQSQTPPVEFKMSESGQVRPFGSEYGEVLVSVSFDAGIEQLLNLLAELTAQKELIATNEIHVGMAHPKQKLIPVRLTVSGIVRKQLIPAKRGFSSL